MTPAGELDEDGDVLGLELGEVDELGDELGEPDGFGVGDAVDDELGAVLGAVVLGVEVLLPPQAATASTSAKLP